MTLPRNSLNISIGFLLRNKEINVRLNSITFSYRNLLAILKSGTC